MTIDGQPSDFVTNTERLIAVLSLIEISKLFPVPVSREEMLEDFLRPVMQEEVAEDGADPDT